MAIALLANGAVNNIHHAKYDLESLMYVAFYCATMLKGPNNTWRESADCKAHTSIPMREWFDVSCIDYSYGKMARTKLGHMTMFENSIINRMESYFSPLFAGFRALKSAVLPSPEDFVSSPIVHDVMISIFNEILESLPAEHTVATQMKRGTKRRRAGDVPK